MALSQRFRPALGACLKHLSASTLVAALCGGLVFGLWYPYPYSDLVGGRDLFLLMVSVDVICGPLLTLIIFDKKKQPTELYTDLAIVICLQLAALAYGLVTTIHARPIFMAFEGDRFRTVSLPDIDLGDLPNAAPEFSRIGYGGPRLIGVKLAKPSDPDFVRSIKQSLEGLPPAFRPSRWVSYEQLREDVARNSRPIALLRQKAPKQGAQIDKTIEELRTDEYKLGYLPLQSNIQSSWVVIVSLDNSQPKAYLPIDGW